MYFSFFEFSSYRYFHPNPIITMYVTTALNVFNWSKSDVKKRSVKKTKIAQSHNKYLNLILFSKSNSLVMIMNSNKIEK